jgi:hypothetical protein
MDYDPFFEYVRSISAWQLLGIVGIAEEGTIMKKIFIGLAVAFAFATGMALTTIIAQIAS